MSDYNETDDSVKPITSSLEYDNKAYNDEITYVSDDISDSLIETDLITGALVASVNDSTEVRRGRGRPKGTFRVPQKDPNAPKRPRGRPKGTFKSAKSLEKQSESVVKLSNSVNTIYEELLHKRLVEKKYKEAKDAEAERKFIEAKIAKDNLSSDTKVATVEEELALKREKRERSYNQFREILIGLTGDDLEYSKPKKDKKRFSKWIDDDIDSSLDDEKKKTVKKKNYNKVFDPELSMLRSMISDQNRYTADIQKRFYTMAGPNTKDAIPLNKNMIELAEAVNVARNTSLSILKEISSTKKTIADLYMKQKKMELDAMGSNSATSSDPGIVGSELANGLFNGGLLKRGGNSGFQQPTPVGNSFKDITDSSEPLRLTASPIMNNQFHDKTSDVVTSDIQPQQPFTVDNSFDPESWNSNHDVSYASLESIPHEVVVEYDKENKTTQYKAYNKNTGDELTGYELPSFEIKTIDEDNSLAKDSFDTIYPLRYKEGSE